jgi:hypothetical protein
MTDEITDLDQPSLHYVLKGEIIDYVASNGTFLVIRTESGKEVKVAWVDSDTGEPLKGKPALRYAGLRLKVYSAGQIFK